jgi:hypothetical protein
MVCSVFSDSALAPTIECGHAGHQFRESQTRMSRALA